MQKADTRVFFGEILFAMTPVCCARHDVVLVDPICFVCVTNDERPEEVLTHEGRRG